MILRMHIPVFDNCLSVIIFAQHIVMLVYKNSVRYLHICCSPEKIFCVSCAWLFCHDAAGNCYRAWNRKRGSLKQRKYVKKICSYVLTSTVSSLEIT